MEWRKMPKCMNQTGKSGSWAIEVGVNLRELEMSRSPGLCIRSNISYMRHRLADVGAGRHSTRIWVDGNLLKIRMEEIPTAPESRRFAVFAYEDYYPGGGWNDFQASYNTLEEAISDMAGRQIVDLHTGKIVWGGGKPRDEDR